MRESLKDWVWYSVQMSVWNDGVEGPIQHTDVIEKNMIAAQRQVMELSKNAITIYGIHRAGTAQEYYDRLTEITASIIEEEEEGSE